MVAWEARVGGVFGEQVYTAGVGDERPGAIVELGDDLDDEQRETGAQPSSDRRATHRREALVTGKNDHDHEQQEVQRLRRVYVGQQRILDRIVVVEEPVERMNDRPIHRTAFSRLVHISASPRETSGIVSMQTRGRRTWNRLAIRRSRLARASTARRRTVCAWWNSPQFWRASPSPITRSRCAR